MIPKTVAERSKKQRRRLAGHAREGKQNAGNNSFGSCLHHDVDDGFPTTHAEGERCFTITVRHEEEHFLGRAHDQWHHHQAERESTRISGKAFETQDDKPIDNNSPNDGGNAVQHIRDEAQHGVGAGGPIFREVNSAQHTNRHADDGRQPEQFERADDRVRHAAADRADWFGQLGEEIPVHRTRATLEQMKEDETEWRDNEDRGDECQRGSERTFDFAPNTIRGGCLHSIERHGSPFSCPWFSKEVARQG